jgi:hypothetical protein
VVQRWSIYVCMPRFGVKNVGFNLCLDETKLIAAARHGLLRYAHTAGMHVTYGMYVRSSSHAAGMIICP